MSNIHFKVKKSENPIKPCKTLFTFKIIRQNRGRNYDQGSNEQGASQGITLGNEWERTKRSDKRKVSGNGPFEQEKY